MVVQSLVVRACSVRWSWVEMISKGQRHPDAGLQTFLGWKSRRYLVFSIDPRTLFVEQCATSDCRSKSVPRKGRNSTFKVEHLWLYIHTF